MKSKAPAFAMKAGAFDFAAALYLRGIRNCGKTSIAEIMDHLFAYQYSIIKPEHKDIFFNKILEMNL